MGITHKKKGYAPIYLVFVFLGIRMPKSLATPLHHGATFLPPGFTAPRPPIIPLPLLIPRPIERPMYELNALRLPGP